MNKGEFIKHIAIQHSITQDEANKTIDMFTSSVTSALADGNDISLIGFGNFSVSKVSARDGRNPRTGADIKISAYNQPKFRAGKKLKDAVNNKYVSANLKCTTNLHEKCTTKKGHKIKSVNVNIDNILIQNEVVLYDRYSNVYNNTNLAQTRR